MMKARGKSDKWEEVALSAFLLICFLLAFVKDLFPSF
jgi:hypothetical protein